MPLDAHSRPDGCSRQPGKSPAGQPDEYLPTLPNGVLPRVSTCRRPQRSTCRIQLRLFPCVHARRSYTRRCSSPRLHSTPDTNVVQRDLLMQAWWP